MGIAAAIIAGVVGITAASVSAAGASKTAKAAEEAAAEQAMREEEEMRKQRDIQSRTQNLQGLDYLAQQRQSAEVLSRQRSFGRDIMTALANLGPATTARAATGTMPMGGGIGTTTLRRAA